MPRKTRLWPLILILLLEGACLLYIWVLYDTPVRQARVTATLVSLVPIAGLCLLWFLFLSRLPGKIRLLGLGLLALLATAFVAAFEFEGMSGDLVPQFRSRFGGVDTFSGSGSLSGFSVSDYPQFQGPDRNAILNGLNLNLDWEKAPPELLWKRSVGDGIGGFSVSGSVAVTQEQADGEERIVAYDLASGERLWEHQLRPTTPPPSPALDPAPIPPSPTAGSLRWGPPAG